MLKSILNRRAQTFHVSQEPPGYIVKGYGESTYAGEYVTVEGSLSVTAVLAGFTILMEDIASLPLILFQNIKGGSRRAYENPYYTLLHDAPNPEHTSMVFREFIMGHLLGWGNFYGQMIWDKTGVVREMWPLRPDRMKVFRENGARKYLYTTQNGQPRAFRADEILHIPAFGFDGLQGYSRIQLARNAIGLSMAAEKYGSKVFENDARPSIALMHPKKMTQEAYDRLLTSWNDNYRKNNGKAGILEEGLDIKEIGFPPEDAQFLQTRQFQVAEIARIFRIPPHMLGDTATTTNWGTGIEQQEQGYMNHTLRPWMVRTEQQLNKDLLLSADRSLYYFEHLPDAMLRTDTKSRMDAYAVAILNGIMSPNEARRRENLNPYAGGDSYRMPLNTGQVGTAPQKNALPLLQDAAQRIARREINEVSGAENRSKGKPNQFAAWRSKFYRETLPEFITLSFAPVAAAGLLLPDDPQKIATRYSQQREEDTNPANTYTVEDLAETIVNLLVQE